MREGRGGLQGQLPVFALVGYTNAGKSTLLNHLTGAGVLAEDKLFATLDPTTRRVLLPGGKEVAFPSNHLVCLCAHAALSLVSVQMQQCGVERLVDLQLENF